MLLLTPSAGMHFMGSQIVGVPLLTLNISSDASLLPNDRAHPQYCSTHNGGHAGIENKLSEISLLLFPNQAIFPNRDSYI